MRVSLLIDIDGQSLYNAHLAKESIMPMTLETLAEIYESYSLDYDCGFNPEQITNDGVS